MKYTAEYTRDQFHIWQLSIQTDRCYMTNLKQITSSLIQSQNFLAELRGAWSIYCRVMPEFWKL